MSSLNCTAFCRTLAVLCFLGWVARNSHAAEVWTLAQDASPPVRIETQLRITGNLHLHVTSGAKKSDRATALPLKVTSQVTYQEKRLGWTKSDESSSSARFYSLAKAQMTVGRGEIESHLSDDRRLICSAQSKQDHLLYSPAGPLTRDELDLLEQPCSGTSITSLLPIKNVKLGDTWSPTEQELARLLCLDSIQQTDIACKLKSADNKQAIITVGGKCSGAIDGIASDIELLGELAFDVKAKIATRFHGKLKEVRASSQGAPGFDTEAEFETKIAASQAPPELSDELLKQISATPDAATRLLRFTSRTQGVEILHEPNWRVVADQDQMAILRLMDRGEMVAQCNLSRLDGLGTGEQLSLEGFQQDIKSSLKGTFSEFIEATQSLNDNKLRVLRVVASGVVSEVPIHWVFYHISDDGGNRVSLVFTMDSEMAERFAQHDQTLLGTLQISPPSDGSVKEKQEAKKPAKVMKK